MKINRSLKFIADSNEIFLYDQEMTSGRFWVCRPPRSVHDVLWQAWITIRSGDSNKTVEEAIKHLRFNGISAKAAEWAIRKANEHCTSRMGFMKFADHYRGV